MNRAYSLPSADRKELRADRISSFDLSWEATVELEDGSLRNPVEKPPLIKIEFESGKTLLAEILTIV